MNKYLIPLLILLCGYSFSQYSGGNGQGYDVGRFPQLSPQKRIVLISPNGDAILYAGYSNEVRWVSSGVASIKVLFSTDNGLHWADIIENVPSNPGVIFWTVPDISSKTCKIRITDEEDEQVYSQNEEPFWIMTSAQTQPLVYQGGTGSGYNTSENSLNSGGEIFIISPLAGENLFAGYPKNIVWIASRVRNVNISASYDNGDCWYQIANGITSIQGSFSWHIPDTISAQVKLKISDAEDSSICATTGLLMRIVQIPLLTQTVFNGGIGSGYSNSNGLLNSNLVISLELKALIEGLYNPITNRMISDTVSLFLNSTTQPYQTIDSSKIVLDSCGNGSVKFTNAENGGYYLVLKHRNSLETWSKTGGETIIKGQPFSYDFTIDSLMTLGGNVIQKGSKWCIYSGDVNQDGFIDFSDILKIDNEAFNYSKGYVLQDLNGDGVVDFSDIVICDNNAINHVSVRRPVSGVLKKNNTIKPATKINTEIR